MTHKFPSAAFVVLLLSACAAVPPKAPVAAVAEPVAKPATPAKQEVAQPAPKQPVLPKQELSQQVLYQFLLAEVAGQRGDFNLATKAYVDLAKKTRDPRLAKRATEVAIFSRIPEQALEAATLWGELDPEAVQAKQSAAALLVNTGRLDEAKPLLEKLIAAEGANAGTGFMQLNGLMGRLSDKQAGLRLVQSLAAPYPDLAEAHFAIAQAAANADQRDLALAEARQAAKLRPGWELSALLQAQILQASSKPEALDSLRSFLKDYPKSKEVRLTLARLLASEQQFAAARDEFKQLLADFPATPEAAMAVGLLSLQLNDLDTAETYLKQTLELGIKDESTVRLYLGQVSEEHKRFDEAARWYGSIGEGEQYLPAQIKVALMLGKQGKLGEARKHLQQIAVQNNQQRVLVIQAEAQLLRDAKDYKDAFDLLTRGLEKLPNYPELLYDRAMMAEKIDRMEVMEQDLRRLIQLKPDNAHAYNALGYSLADRGDRLNEAYDLIDKALKIAPGEAFIMDSMGWVYYRMGNLPKALEYLNRAYTLRPDPEIAAHLGEVQWAQGKRDDAQKTWQTSLKDNPQNESLLGVLKKFKP
jgi:tetratricopeptide (TPR) repeat protein